MTYIKDLFINKTISESSKQLYMNNLNKLNLNKPIEDLDFLKNVEEIKTIISKYKSTTKRSFIIAVISVIKDNPELYKNYFELLTKMNREVKIDNFKQIYNIDNLERGVEITT